MVTKAIRWLQANAPDDADIALIGLTTMVCAGGIVALIYNGG